MSTMKNCAARMVAVMLCLTGAIRAHGVTNILSGISPASAPQGTNGLLLTFTLGSTPPPPPTNVPLQTATIGTISGTSLQRVSTNQCTAVFNIPPNETPGVKTVVLFMPASFYAISTNGFSVTAAPLAANFSAVPTAGTVPLAVTFADASTGVISNRLWNFGDGGTSTNSNPTHTYTNVGTFSVSLSVMGSGGSNTMTKAGYITATTPTNGPWRFAVFSDTHVTNDVGVLPEIAASVVADGAKLVLCSGDIAEGGLGATSAELQSELLLWRNAMGPVYSNGIGVYVLRGNHEDDAANDLAAWTNVFSGAYAMPGNGPAGESNLTYSFTYNNALFLGFDNYVNLHQVNQTWLDQQLASNALPHIFPFGHEAAFKVFHGDCLGSVPTNRNAFWSSIASAGARAYFCGHDHFFDVARIDDGDGNASNDLYQCEVGTSGGWFMAQYNYNGTNSPYTPSNICHVTNEYGYLLVEVSGPANTNLDVTMTWKRRAFDTNTSGYVYLATTSVITYTARYNGPTNSGLTGTYLVADTGQTNCYGNTSVIAAPAAGQTFYGQDAQLFGNQPGFTLSGDGLTVYDRNTGLTWQRSPDTTGDGFINITDKLTWAQAQARPAVLNAANFGGFSDWRLPSIKEQYSLIDFRGTDPSGLAGNSTSGLTPYIDTNYFKFAYGNTNEGDRIIDSQYASCTLYVSTSFGTSLFGVNFADGRIKGYGLNPGGGEKTFFVTCVRGNASYGTNNLVDNGDQTVTDLATGLMWMKGDSGAGMTWSNALAWAQARNATNHLGHVDWRLPNVKELQSILDYTRSPDTTASAAIDPVFNCTPITNENLQLDWPWYWSGTTHATYTGNGASGSYVCFGRGLGYMNSAWVDIHGAGCQRSDPKSGSLTSYTFAVNGWYSALAPQGDAIRISNFVRLVRGGYNSAIDHVGDGIPDWWRRENFGGAGTTTNSTSCSTSDSDGDGMTVLEEYLADTNPTNGTSRLEITAIAPLANGTQLLWIGGTGVTQIVESTRDLAATNGTWTPIATNVPPTLITNSVFQSGASVTNMIFRIRAWR